MAIGRLANKGSAVLGVEALDPEQQSEGIQLTDEPIYWRLISRGLA